jgi:integrase
MTGRPAKVTVAGLRRRNSSWRVRWRVEERDLQRTFPTRQQADRFRRKLLDAVDAGAVFDIRTGEPRSWGPKEIPTVAGWAKKWLALRWPELAASTRAADAETVVEVVCATLLREPDERADVRAYVRREICGRPGVEPELPMSNAEALAGAHVSRWSPRLDHVDRDMARTLWARLAVLKDGSTAAVTTARRRRTLATKLFDDAVREELLETNPLRSIERPRRKVANAVDPTKLPTVAELRRVIAAIEATGERGRRFGAFLTVLLLTGARPEEVHALEVDDITWPVEPGGWGVVHLSKVLTQSASAYTDDGASWQSRNQLKWRAPGEVRQVPIPPELVDRLREHLDEFPHGEKRRIITNAAGGPLTQTTAPLWRAGLAEVWPDGRHARLRPYDLRHVHATALLVQGVPPTRVAARLGHSVQMLYSTYAGVLSDETDGERDLIVSALADLA